MLSPQHRAASLSSILLLLAGTAVPAHSQLLPTLPTATSQALLVEDAYTLGAGDIIEINLFQVPEYSGPTQVLVDGTLNLPLAGVVDVNGMTLRDAADAISAQYAPYYRRPIVTLSLLSARPVRFSISGEVSSAGSYTFNIGDTSVDSSLSSARLATLTSAIQAAGGVTASADVRQIQISRPQRTSSGQTQTELITVNLWELVQDGQLINDITLRDGDAIAIPAAETIDLAEARQLASANLYSAERPIDVAVVGEVKRPGPHTIALNTAETDGLVPTVTRAIQVAGGITEIANVRQIEVRRQGPSGTSQTLNIDLWKLLQEGDINQDTVLQNGDTVYIPTASEIDPAIATELATATFSPDIISVYVVGEVVTPGLVEVPPNTPLNQAILAAGGFDNQRADRGEVTLIRLNPDGTVEERDISIDFASGLSDSENPALRSNDVIVVGRSGITSFSDTLSSIVAPVSNIFPIVNILRLFGL